MKKYRTAIIAFVLIVAALVGYYIVKNVQADEPASPTGDEAGARSVFPFSQDVSTRAQITEIRISGEETILLTKTAEGWTCAQWPDEEILQSAVNGMISRIYSYQGPVVYEGDVSEDVRREFGLTGEKKFSITMKNGTVYTAIFGSLNTTGGSHYLWLEGSDKICMYAKAFREGIFVNKADLVSNIIFNFSDSNQVTKIDIMKDGEDYIYLTAQISGNAGEGRKWTMHTPVQRPGHNNNIQAFLDKLTGVTIDKVIVSDCTDLTTYGLSPASYSVALTAPDKTITLNIGNKTPDGTGYYFTIDKGTEVYTTKVEQITFKDVSPIQYLDEDVFILDYTKLSTVRISFNGQEHTMKFEFKGEDEIFYFDGRRVPEEKADYFTRVLSALYFLEITGLDVEHAPETPSGEILCSLRYEQSDGTVTTVTCAARDESTMYFYVNDVYTGGYGPRYMLTSDAANYGVQGTIAVLMQQLNLKA